MSDTTYFVTAVAAVIFKNDKILAMKRAVTKDAGPGLWETLSGRIDKDEDPLQAVKREIQEECGLNVEVNPRPVTAYHAYRKGIPMILVVYSAEYLSGEVLISEEHDEYCWVSPQEFSKLSELERLVDAVYLAEKLRDI